MKLKVILTYITIIVFGQNFLTNAQEKSDLKKTEFEMSVYPNPAFDNLRLKIPARNNETVQVEIINILGEKVKELKLETNDQNVDISQLKEGLYIVAVTFQNKRTLKKFYKK